MTSQCPYAYSRPIHISAATHLSKTADGCAHSIIARYHAYPLSNSELEALPYADARVGWDNVAEAMPSPQIYDYAWTDRIASVSRKLKDGWDAVGGQDVQV